jgi:uncharacterized protein involved in outer membrane biogenesis
MRKIIVIFSASILLISFGVIAYLYFSLNTLVKKAVETVGPAITRTDVTLASANLSPFSGNGRLDGFVVDNPKGYSAPYAVRIGSIAVSVDKESLLKDPIVVNSIEIRDPQLALIGTPGGTNLQEIMRNIKSYGASKEKPATLTASPSSSATSAANKSESKKFLVKSVVISGAKVDVVLGAFGQSVKQSLTLPEIRLQNLGSNGQGLSASQLSEQILTPLINAAIDEGIKAASKQGLLQLQQNGGKEIGNFLKGLFK